MTGMIISVPHPTAETTYLARRAGEMTYLARRAGEMTYLARRAGVMIYLVLVMFRTGQTIGITESGTSQKSIRRRCLPRIPEPGSLAANCDAL
jgi:hypothetical protein